ncbi:MAG: hypothetical protein VX278_03245 [Myxococcota bacterium]|nr:hypothetical protein [Myxococcota bacterium]
MFILLFSAFAKPPCAVEISSQTLKRQLDSAELGFVKADREQVATSMETLSGSVSCLNERLNPEMAARYHLIHGFYEWVSNNEEGTKRSFAIARKTDPNATIPEHIFPANHIIHTIYNETPPADYIPIQETPETGEYCFDGYLLPRRPKDAPTLLQIIDRKKVLYSAYLEPNTTLPSFKKSKTHHKTIALGLSAASLFAGIGLQFHSQLLRQDYKKHRSAAYDAIDSGYLRQEHLEELDSHHQAHTQQYQRSIIGFAGASVLFGASFFLEW